MLTRTVEPLMIMIMIYIYIYIVRVRGNSCMLCYEALGGSNVHVFHK